MRVRTGLLAAALVLAPLAARSADLVVWWEEGFNPGEDEAIRETVAAFERKTGKAVELTFHPQKDVPGWVLAAVEAGRPPDFLYNTVMWDFYDKRAYEGRLVSLTDALGPLAAQFDQDALAQATLLDGTTGRRGLYALPMAHGLEHLHVWRDLLERAGFTLADIPKEWEPFWSFWCDQIQPAVRKALGRDDVYGVGLPMSVGADDDTEDAFRQFVEAYGADYVTRDGRLVIDQAGMRDRLLRALDSYTLVWRKGCTPPDATGWDNYGNNKAFLARTVVMTPNPSLSIPNALRDTRPEDYYKNTTTIEWPSGPDGRPPALFVANLEAVVFRDGGHEATAKEFARFLVAEGWLAHWLDFVGDRWLPALPALLEQPFWLDTGDPHRMASAMQFLTQPHTYDYAVVSGERRHARVGTEAVWSTAVHRVAADGLTPERAVDEAIARVHQLLGE